jgi:hypothetical protein
MAYGREGGFAGPLLGAFLIGLGLTAAGWWIGSGLVEARVVAREVTVKGLAERDVKADRAHWPITLSAGADTLAEAQAQIDAAVALTEAFLAEAGFDPAEIGLGRLQLEDRLAQTWGAERPAGGRFYLIQPVQVRSADVDKVATTSRRLGDLVRQGVVVSSWQGPSYSFTSLNDVKPGMLEEATANARTAADTLIAGSGLEIDGVRRGSQGLFEILPRDDSAAEAESEQIFKRVRVVVTMTYSAQ